MRREGEDHLLLHGGHVGLGFRARFGARDFERRPVALASSARDQHLALERVALGADPHRRHGVVALRSLGVDDLRLGVLESQMVEPRVLVLHRLRHLFHRGVLHGERARLAADADEFALAQEDAALRADLVVVGHQHRAELRVAVLRDLPQRRVVLFVGGAGCFAGCFADAVRVTALLFGQEREQLGDPSGEHAVHSGRGLDRLVIVREHDWSDFRGRVALVDRKLDAARRGRVVVDERDWSRSRHGFTTQRRRTQLVQRAVLPAVRARAAPWRGTHARACVA